MQFHLQNNIEEQRKANQNAIGTTTINVASNPGSATCDPTIATAKGYTVVTS